jgi:thiol:disulfide interchange protein
MFNKIFLTFSFFILSVSLFAQFASPFKWKSRMKGDSIFIEAEIPPKHYLYFKSTSVKLWGASGKELTAQKVPESVLYSKEKYKIYKAGKAEWVYKKGSDFPYKAKVKFQGCSIEPFACYPPGVRVFEIKADDKEKSNIKSSSFEKVSSKLEDDESSAVMNLLERFKIEKSGGGYISPHEFLAFISDDENAKSSGFLSFVISSFVNGGVFLKVLLTLLFGVMSNLTPCVLPMIPINLAIIGAGSGVSKFNGFVRGGVYGSGIAFAYGAIGLLVVLTSARFGDLNSMWWFNFAIALIFIFLALAMFDVISIDFSKYGSKINPSKSQKGKLLTAFFLGGVAALLAGACVAPLLLAVIVHSSGLYLNGDYLGLFLPLVFGIGMALPWPIAGAGLSIMPKPGKWMVRIKQSMGVFILLAAVYYAYLGYELIPSSSGWSAESQFVSLRSALKRAEREKKPVFIDFWASWCAACKKMEASTFKNPMVKEELRNFVVVKFQAERPSNDQIDKLLKHFGVVGLPSYYILRLKDSLQEPEKEK